MSINKLKIWKMFGGLNKNGIKITKLKLEISNLRILTVKVSNNMLMIIFISSTILQEKYTSKDGEFQLL